MPSASPKLTHPPSDPLAGVDTIIAIDNGAQNIRIASIPYPFPIPSSSSSIDPHTLASSIPIETYPNAIARTRSPHTIPPHSSPTGPAAGSKTSIFVSSHIHTLLDDYAALHLRLPHQSGVIIDWSAQKTIWDHVLTTHLTNTAGLTGKAKLLSRKAVIITEAYLNPEPVQYATDLLLFEHYGATAVWRTNPANLIAISPQRPQSMLVLDLGYSFCHAIPVINSQPQLGSVRRLELGGKMLINLLKETLSFKQLDMMDESWLISHIFNKVSFVAAEQGERLYETERELKRVEGRELEECSYEDLLLLDKRGKGSEIVWRLPDYERGTSKEDEGVRERARYGFAEQGPARGKRRKLHYDSELAASTATVSKAEDGDSETQSLTLNSERFSIVENLFNPSSLALDQQPLPELIRSSIASLPTEWKSAGDMMWSNIFLSGGLANTVGMKNRLENELRPLAPDDVPVRILPEREVDKSLLPIQAAVSWAIQLSSKREKAGKGKGRGRKSDFAGGQEGAARWLTYSQWCNPAVMGGGSPSESDIVKAANNVFYPMSST